MQNISQVFHCHGLLLCVFRHIKYIFVVWNPYWGTRRWIKHRINNSGLDWFAFGYEQSCRQHKILMFFYNRLEIYDLSSDSWRVLDATLDRNIKIEYGKHGGVSLKGNTYWYARGTESRDCFLLCFDFTRERFGPRLPLPFNSNFECDVSLSAVREEQLALLKRPHDTLEMEIWVTNKIEPDAVSWSNFLKVDVSKSNPLGYFTSFFIEEEKKIAVVFSESYLDFHAFMVGENGYFTRVDLTESADIQLYPFVCSYVPTSVKIL